MVSQQRHFSLGFDKESGYTKGAFLTIQWKEQLDTS
jgi:hypothetical protein